MICLCFVALSSPLFLQYNPDLTEDETKRVTAWQTHWNTYGRGITMYRTNELYELIFQGIPKSLREELWFVFSGAIHEVRVLFFFVTTYHS